MDDYTHLLTGYIGNYAILEKIEHLVQKLKAKHPDLLYVCDTVMGDCGQLYVSSEIVPLYRSIMKWADVVTPNQFEAETLTETDIHGLEDACLVASKLHQLGSPFVVITSLSLPLTDVPPEIQTESSTDQSLYCLTSQVLSNGTLDQHLISFPTYQGYFTGTGDLFSALTVARLQESLDQKTSWIEAIERVICSVNAITKKTWLYQQALAVNTKPSTAKSVRQCELRLIQGRNEIEHPELYLNVMKRMHVSK
ncbi:pyridoxal kinase [Gilbertella persicaria]|nr:pyridoxal kinase [Gilbertella persicaria]KAI8087995.1 pyridoxal kinase [Gilbertella persicaria]